MNDTCLPSSNNTILGINSMLHVVILFAFLSFLFVYIISKLAREVLVKEITHNIEKSLGENIKNMTREQKDLLKRLPLEALKEIYKEEHEVVAKNNKWLLNTIILINLMFVLIVTGFIVTLKYSCGQCPPIGSILFENAIIFTFIGVVEYLFFMKIAFKFIPSPPSHILTAAKTSLERQLDKYSNMNFNTNTDFPSISDIEKLVR